LFIWGAGGHGKVVLDVARSTGRFERIAFLDDDPTKSDMSFCDCEVVGGTQAVGQFEGSWVVIAVGDNRLRAQCFRRALAEGLLATALVHERAVISRSASIGPGTVVMPGAIVNAGAIVGENCIINTAAVIEHDCSIGAHAHISPRVALGGNVSVGPFAHVGIGAVVLPGAAVGEEAIVGAGAVVLKEAPARCTVVGVPAKTLTYA
jgi:acetyltransferase EpsM